jgi:hypothetical protein
MQPRKVVFLGMLLTLVFFEAAEARAQGGSFGGGVIGPGSPPMALAGTSGGPRSASMMGSNCRGNIAMVPDHVFTVTSPMMVRFEVISQAGDTTLVVVGPSGVFCDDDSAGSLRPRVMQQLMPGQYQVFVGTYGGSGMYPYTIQVSGQGGYGAPVPVPVPMGGGGRFGSAVIGPGQMYANMSGVSGGPISSSTYGGHCRGWVAGMADHILTVTSPMVITFDVSAPGDTTLVITGPTGVLCDDDSGGSANPRITRPLSPGRYEIRVGSYSSGNTYPYTLSIHP